MTTNYFIIKTDKEGVKLLSIDDLTSYKFSLQRVLDTKRSLSKDDLHVQITDSHLIIACINLKWDRNDGNYKRII